MGQLKFVSTLSEEQTQQLREMYQYHQTFSCRRRAQAILLSANGYTITQIEQILQVDRDTISVWFNRFAQWGVLGLKDLARSGRPRIYNAQELEQLKAFIDQEPRLLKQAQARLEQQTGKSSCRETLKRALKKF